MISLLLYIPLFIIIGERWRAIIWKDARITLIESIKMCLAGVTLNSFIPSKIGEFTKAYFLKNNSTLSKVTLKRGINCVIVEKLLDLFSLSIWLLIGLILIKITNYIYLAVIISSVLIILTTIIYFNFNFVESNIFRKLFWFLFKYKQLKNMIIDTQEFIFTLKQDKDRLFYLFFLSIFLWFVQLTQIYLLFLSLNYFVQLKLVLGLVPIAILFGLIPITVAGMGTRDSALIFLFLEYAPPSLMAGIGILLSTRIWIPSLLGLPFFKKHVSKETINH